MGILLLTVLVASMAPGSDTGISAYPTRPDDARAVYVSARGDGAADDTDAIQKAIDQVQETQG